MKRFLALVAVVLLAGCQRGIPEDALALNGDTLERRQLESRRFSGTTDTNILAACAGVAQDMGFAIDESEAKLGILACSKNREASSGGDRFAMALFLGANAANSMDRDQKIRLCIVVKPAGKTVGKEWVVRATFQRIVRNSYGQVTKLEWLGDEELYQEFFQKLSKSVFLEAQKI